MSLGRESELDAKTSPPRRPGTEVRPLVTLLPDRRLGLGSQPLLCVGAHSVLVRLCLPRASVETREDAEGDLPVVPALPARHSDLHQLVQVVPGCANGDTQLSGHTAAGRLTGREQQHGITDLREGVQLLPWPRSAVIVRNQDAARFWKYSLNALASCMCASMSCIARCTLESPKDPSVGLTTGPSAKMLDVRRSTPMSNGK